MKSHSKRVEKMWKLHSNRVENMWNLHSNRVENMWELHSNRVQNRPLCMTFNRVTDGLKLNSTNWQHLWNQPKNTLETSGEHWKTHSKRVRKIENTLETSVVSTCWTHQNSPKFHSHSSPCRCCPWSGSPSQENSWTRSRPWPRHWRDPWWSQSYRYLTVVLNSYGVNETYSRIGLLRGQGNLANYKLQLHWTTKRS